MDDLRITSAIIAAVVSLLATWLTNRWQLKSKMGELEHAQLKDEFLLRLNQCHAECGVFFSQPVYEQFFVFRDALIRISETFTRGAQPSATDLDALEMIYSGKDGPGLATQLKADLGSYRPVIFRQSE